VGALRTIAHERLPVVQAGLAEEVTMQVLLSEFRYGRVLLHVICAVRDRHVRWHWLGIRREFLRKAA
jgi:hypothetical protein